MRYFIVGGGASLNDIDLPALKNEGKFIACNNAYKICPWAEAMIFGDDLWATWNLEHLLENFNGKIFCGSWHNKMSYPERVIKLVHTDFYGIELERGKIRGNNTGQMGVNLAVQMGATEIILLGFDMCPDKNGKTNWHTEHQRKTNTNVYKTSMIPAMETVAKDLDILGIKVYNANINSELKMFDYVKITGNTIENVHNGSSS